MRLFVFNLNAVRNMFCVLSQNVYSWICCRSHLRDMGHFIVFPQTICFTLEKRQIFLSLEKFNYSVVKSRWRCAGKIVWPRCRNIVHNWCDVALMVLSELKTNIEIDTVDKYNSDTTMFQRRFKNTRIVKVTGNWWPIFFFHREIGSIIIDRSCQISTFIL